MELKFKVKGKGNGENQAYKLRAEVIRRAEEKGIKVPKNITISGTYDRDYEICYTTLAVKQLISEIASEWKLKAA